MDGVIADFVTGVCLAHNRPSPYLDIKSRGIFDMEKLWGISIEEFWKPTRFEGFWKNLPKTEDADEIVEMVLNKFGKNVSILTAPSEDPNCLSEKKIWMQKHFPDLASKMIFCSANRKQLLAGPKRFLVDDRDKNIEEFEKAGGTGLTVPRLWNHLHRLSDSSMSWLKLQSKWGESTQEFTA